MVKTYTINANEVLALLNEAKQRGAGVSISGKVGNSDIDTTDSKFAIGLISVRHSRIDRNTVTGIHTVVDNGVKEYHTIGLESEVPPYRLEIKYSLRSEDADHYGGVFGFFGLMKDVSKALLRWDE